LNQDCGTLIAHKFFPEDVPSPKKAFCETCCFRSLDLICHNCRKAIRGPYIPALGHKYHVEHFTCAICDICFATTDTYFDHEDKLYCRYHYSTKIANRCKGCQDPILKQFVQLPVNGILGFWHPECYMIHKYWNIRVAEFQSKAEKDITVEGSEADAESYIAEQSREEQMLNIWRTLATFEQICAKQLSGMLSHSANSASGEFMVSAVRLICMIEGYDDALSSVNAFMESAGLESELRLNFDAFLPNA
jgi:LIM domain